METFSVEIVTPIKILNQDNVSYIRCPGIDGSFYRVFLGLVIISSALLNENIRKRIMGNI